jgi:hypothetical protein
MQRVFCARGVRRRYCRQPAHGMEANYFQRTGSMVTVPASPESMSCPS